ncbi:response regulator transcription factor [Terrisporobacter vanillatitrophus]|uniref:response regulator transcription factor n=1 Tax=Terrisporobacter vanillatitrophus TaxID=3058402 RepID=UPI003368CE71
MELKKILIIEDEEKIARFIQLELKYEGYEVDICHDGREGLNKTLKGNYDLIILDVMLPSLNGMEVLRRIRQSSDIQVIMLTAKDDVMDKVMGLDIGADDYMTKPFAIEELLARIRLSFKRMNKSNTSVDTNDEITSIGGLFIDDKKHIVSYKDDEIELTKKEYDLLKYLVDNKNMVLTRDMIVKNIWGYDFIGDSNVVDVYIRYLRTKIDNKFNINLINTVRGVGYQIKDE